MNIETMRADLVVEQFSFDNVAAVTPQFRSPINIANATLTQTRRVADAYNSNSFVDIVNRKLILEPTNRIHETTIMNSGATNADAR